MRWLDSRKLEADRPSFEEAAADGGRDPMLIQKSAGTYLYGTVDLATVRQRVQDDGFDRVIYVTDGAQKRHFRQVFDVARRAGWTRGAAGHEARLEHVTFGTVQGADGRKLSSRDGGTLPLSALLDRAAAAAQTVQAGLASTSWFSRPK